MVFSVCFLFVWVGAGGEDRTEVVPLNIKITGPFSTSAPTPAKGRKDDEENDSNREDYYNDALSKPRPVHRLDSATGGLLVVAKTHSSEVALKKCFSDKTIRKRYRAIVFGRLEGTAAPASASLKSLPPSSSELSNHLKGTIDSPISGKESLTHYTVVSYTRCPLAKAHGWITTVDLEPVTGRQHQLRRHLKLVGHPIW